MTGPTDGSDGRLPEALSVYDRVARLLDEDLGLEPGPGCGGR
ncbi:DNA-binding SARP family transcriptional activator [Amycolatopsis bartoniae]|uniref:Bacterial transcriptional activator domain-containing protein n=1 Tax=Amycolatopsis bartoniae TaxID=941986 RepID=A0A8H9IP56_9PSEU|nr:BTAD domain-containing putative transcriptional regulator [Amycolatopsis bartoniae]MBB2937931.1 DNA-binding SARP family transcriptional activator [Amycolatopsis bartoniae]GHF41787.1 hypothetical protein GCM10017566_14090 [Amycolatopsis bartoniae]